MSGLFFIEFFVSLTHDIFFTAENTLLSPSNHFSYSQWFHWLGSSLCQLIWSLLVSSGGFGVGKLFCMSLPQQPGRPPNSACCGWSRSENSKGQHLSSQCSARRQAKNHQVCCLLPSFNLRKWKGTGNQIRQAVVCEFCRLHRYLYFSPWLIQMKRNTWNPKWGLPNVLALLQSLWSFADSTVPVTPGVYHCSPRWVSWFLSLCFMLGTV